MFRRLFKKILSWLREIWSLFKVIDDAIPKHRHLFPVPATSPHKPQVTHDHPSIQKRRNALQTWEFEEDEPSVVRHRYIELDGYSENLRIDERGRYDLYQLGRFAENFIWIAPNEVDDFVADGIEHATEYIDGSNVLWVDKSDCIEWAFLQYSAIADLL